MDILIYSKPEKVEHKMQDKVNEDCYCFWTTNRPPKIKDINYVYFSDGEKIYAQGTFIPNDVEGVPEIRFFPLERINKMQPKKPPTRGWCYINK